MLFKLVLKTISLVPGKYFGFMLMAEIGMVKKLSLPKENPSNSIFL